MKWLVMAAALLLPQAADADVPAQRLATLTHGVNFIGLFEYKTVPVLLNDIATVHRLGFRHIRMLVDPAVIWQTGEPQRLDRIIQAAMNANLGVILCMHSYVHYFADDPQTVARWTTAWKRLASHYATTNPDLLFFELVNEPPFTDGARWAAIQENLRQEVRAVAPNHTILMTGTPVSTSYALSQLPASKDDNVVYTFHLYAPMVFTHQDADWAGPDYGSVHGLQWPPSEPNLTNVQRKATANVQQDFKLIRQHGIAMIPDEISAAAEWGRQNHTHVMVTEFGVYRAAPLQSRLAWMQQARMALEKFDIGWTVWEYDGGFAIKPDVQFGCGPMLAALGLCKQEHR